MKELKLKIKREYYNIFKELTERQVNSLKVCARICTTTNLSSRKTHISKACS